MLLQFGGRSLYLNIVIVLANLSFKYDEEGNHQRYCPCTQVFPRGTVDRVINGRGNEAIGVEKNLKSC
ncbi:MAG: hypothetical protein IPL08_17295 [Saprospiraceae bacterium]|nr:hypothetical protein [Saprospiraceae bacterium]